MKWSQGSLAEWYGVGCVLTESVNKWICCLLGEQIQDVMNKLSSLIKFTNHYPFLLFPKGMNYTRDNYERITFDYKTLRGEVKDLGAQVMSLSILPVKQEWGIFNPPILSMWLLTLSPGYVPFPLTDSLKYVSQEPQALKNPVDKSADHFFPLRIAAMCP